MSNFAPKIPKRQPTDDAKLRKPVQQPEQAQPEIELTTLQAHLTPTVDASNVPPLTPAKVMAMQALMGNSATVKHLQRTSTGRKGSVPSFLRAKSGVKADVDEQEIDKQSETEKTSQQGVVEQAKTTVTASQISPSTIPNPLQRQNTDEQESDEQQLEEPSLIGELQNVMASSPPPVDDEQASDSNETDAIMRAKDDEKEPDNSAGAIAGDSAKGAGMAAADTAAGPVIGLAWNMDKLEEEWNSSKEKYGGGTWGDIASVVHKASIITGQLSALAGWIGLISALLSALGVGVAVTVPVAVVAGKVGLVLGLLYGGMKGYLVAHNMVRIARGDADSDAWGTVMTDAIDGGTAVATAKSGAKGTKVKPGDASKNAGKNATKGTAGDALSGASKGAGQAGGAAAKNAAKNAGKRAGRHNLKDAGIGGLTDIGIAGVRGHDEAHEARVLSGVEAGGEEAKKGLASFAVQRAMDADGAMAAPDTGQQIAAIDQQIKDVQAGKDKIQPSIEKSKSSAEGTLSKIQDLQGTLQGLLAPPKQVLKLFSPIMKLLSGKLKMPKLKSLTKVKDMFSGVKKIFTKSTKQPTVKAPKGDGKSSVIQRGFGSFVKKAGKGLKKAGKKVGKTAMKGASFLVNKIIKKAFAVVKKIFNKLRKGIKKFLKYIRSIIRKIMKALGQLKQVKQMITKDKAKTAENEAKANTYQTVSDEVIEVLKQDKEQLEAEKDEVA